MKRLLALLLFLPLLATASVDITNIPLGGFAMTDTLLGVTNANWAARGTVQDIAGTATNGWPWTNLTVAHAGAVTNGYPWTNVPVAAASTVPISGVTTPGAILTNGNSYAVNLSNNVFITTGDLVVSNTTPNGKLAYTNATSSLYVTGLVQRLEAGGANTLVVTNGKVGIGKATPAYALDMDGSLTVYNGATRTFTLDNATPQAAGRSANFSFTLPSSGSFSMSSGADGASGADVFLRRDSIGTFRVDTNMVLRGTLTATNGVYYLAQSNSVQALNVLEPIHAWASVMLNNTNVVTIAANTYSNVSGYTLGYTNQFGADLVNGYITNLIAGFYRVAIHASMVAGNADVAEGDFSVNGVQNDNISFVTIYDNPARMKGVSANGIVYLPANSWCAFQIKTSGAGGYTLWRAQMTVGSP